MARRLLIALTLAFLPAVALVVNPELRRVATQDVALLLGIAPALYTLPDDSPQRQEILHLERLTEEHGLRQRVQAYTRLAKETRQPYLYAAAIREAMGSSLGLHLSRTDDFPGPYQPLPPSPEQERKRRQAAQEVLSLSEEMITQDPQNAFPHLAKTCALFALQRDEQALKSLQDAANCPRYMEYELVWARLLSAQGLTAEERALLLASILFPHLPQFRGAMRYVATLAEQSERKGDHERALALREMIASVGAKMRDSNGSILPVLVGLSIQEIAWTRKQDTPLLRERDTARWVEAIASAFALYARQHGRPDLAEETLEQAARSRELWQQIRNYIRENELMEVGWVTPQRRVLSFRAAGVMLLLWSFAMAFLLGTTLILFPMWRQTTLWADRTAPIATALVVGGAFVAIVVGGAFALDGFGNLWAVWMKETLSSERLPSLPLRGSDLRVLHASACAIMGLLAAVCFVPPLIRLSKAGNPSVAWIAAIGALLALGVTAGGTLQSHEAISAEGIMVALAIVAVLWGLSGVVALPFYTFVLRKPLPTPFRAGIAGLWALLSLVAWRGQLTWTGIWLMFGLLLWLLWGRGLSPEAQAEAQHAVYRYSQSALILAIFGLWLYALLGYISLPVRAQQHAYIDQLIEHGEMSLLEGGTIEPSPSGTER